MIVVNDLWIIVLLGHIWMHVEKIEDFERGRKENQYERKRVSRCTINVKNDLKCLFIPKIFSVYYLVYFFFIS